MNLDNLLDKCINSGDLPREEILFLLRLEDQGDIYRLLNAGDTVRRECCGDEVQIRALVEFSNVCARQCNYCGLRAPNTKIKRYRMSPDEIVELAVHLNGKGLKTVVLQSGEDPYYTGEMLADVVRRIKVACNTAITLCVGERSYEDYKLWKEAGADRYLLRHETANRELYQLLHPDSDFDHRMQCLGWLRELGYQTGAGCMVGSPCQTIEHLADDIEFFKDWQPDMAGIGPYISHPDTPYASCETGTLEMTLKMVALARIVTRDALLPATTAIGSIEEQGREMALEAGADVVMPNYTPLEYREHYEIYPNKRCISEDPEHCHGCMRMRIQSVGRTIAIDHGHSRKSR
ncbi:MAG: [FeFe] hydrogenase H-cluster radical SAM maturase HydE [Armatimonadetes bacterium]|nr:[FeFe] hydrogenase H-cluster radical SAM maturase HydE [Armatimonadota bacterium]